MKEMYEQAVKESEQPAARRGAEVRSEKAKSIKEKFERGETLISDGEDGEEVEKKIKDEDLGVFEAGKPEFSCIFCFFTLVFVSNRSSTCVFRYIQKI